MSRSIYITGGIASGKSRFAVSYFSGCDNVLYLKSGVKANWDIINRIEYDCEKHGVSWDVIPSCTLNPSDEVKEHRYVIFDNLFSYTKLVVQEFAPEGEIDDILKKQIEKNILSKMFELREKVAENLGTIIIIGIEIPGVIPNANPRTAVFCDILGRVCQRLANTSDEVYFSASGIQFKIKE